MGTGKAQSRYRERDLSLVRSIPDVAIAATNHFLNRSKTNSRESACSKAASEFVGTFPVDDNPVSQAVELVEARILVLRSLQKRPNSNIIGSKTASAYPKYSG